MKVKRPALKRSEIIAGFVMKVLLGFLYGYIYLHYYNGDDTWKFFRASLSETDLLLNDPLSFFRNEFTPALAINKGEGWKEVLGLYIDDLKYVLVVKTMAFMNLITRGNYYGNVAIFNMILFFGHYWLFLLMKDLFPGKRKLFYRCIFFFLPAVFWLSSIRIDGLLFFFLTLFLLHLVSNRKKPVARIVLLTISFAGVLICRGEIAICLLPASIAYVLSLRQKIRPAVVFALVYFVTILLFFASGLLTHGNGLPQKVVQRQREFIELEGTRFRLDRLEPTPYSFIRILPQAFTNTFIRPYPWEAKGLLQLMASSEILLFWLLVLFTILKRDPDWKLRLQHSVILLLLCLSVSIYLFIGYIVPFPGAIIRYKAIAELLIICCLACCSRAEKSNRDFI